MTLLCVSKNPLKGINTAKIQFIWNHAVRLSSATSRPEDDLDEFRQLALKPTRVQEKTFKRKAPINMGMSKDYKRADKIDPDNVDWKSVWPGPRTFDPNAIPIPVRQGRLKLKLKALDKYANPELMKIPNFFHLTPPAIKAQCEELKKFCTPFPSELDTKEKCEKHFPLTVITNDYLHSAPTIRDPLARIVTVKLKLKDVPLNEHARDKLLRLVKDRYDEKSDTLTITTDRCPLRKQNYDYAQYLLTALFYESWTVEDWESSKTLADMEKYEWDRNISSRALASILNWTPDKLGKAIYHEPLPEDKLKPEHREYSKAVTNVVEGESEEGWSEYKKAAIRVLLRQ